ncbi:MAG TPA: hypothetical protein VFI69_11970 [Candidatus Limnocylindrales bacterium]|nr:hypothetical protein [Candidatus Limnocylindrales bacterium]
MSIDEQHVALPKLYGAPAYARPPAAVATVPKPFDPDDLPIEAWQTEEDREFAANLPARAWAPGGTVVDQRDGHASQGGHDRIDRALLPRQLSLRKIAGRLLGD